MTITFKTVTHMRKSWL